MNPEMCSQSESLTDLSTQPPSPVLRVRRRRPSGDLGPAYANCAARNLIVCSQDDEAAKLPNNQLSNFIWTSSPQPHAVRRRAILEKYPEIENLYGADPLQAIVAISVIIIQIALTYYVSSASLSWTSYFFMTFVVSGTLNHSLFAAMHEGSHRTIFSGKLASEFFCILTTIPMGLPAAIPFKRYHLDHHIYQGVETMDPDLPTYFEGWFFRTTLRKLVWLLLLPGTYSLRPMITRPKNIVIMDVVSWLTNFSVDILVAYFWGIRALGYLLLGTFFSMNFHPFAGHFISEHFIFPNEADIYQETCSYYGPWNSITYNVGYHNEHHDFPRVAGSRLPLVRRIASEFYDIPRHDGWGRVTWKFLLTPTVTPFNRVKRLGVRGGTLPNELQGFQYHKGDIPQGGAFKFWPIMSYQRATT